MFRTQYLGQEKILKVFISRGEKRDKYHWLKNHSDKPNRVLYRITFLKNRKESEKKKGQRKKSREGHKNETT